MKEAEIAVRLPSLREALASLGQEPQDTPDIIGACIIAGGVPASAVPDAPQHRWRNLHENADARLALHALTNVYHENIPRIEATPEWENYRQDPDAAQYMPDTWCEMMTRLMTRQEFDEWISVADRHLDTARIAKYEILPTLAEEYRQDHLLAMTIVQSAQRHCQKHGGHAAGDFALTILEAYRQFNG